MNDPLLGILFKDGTYQIKPTFVYPTITDEIVWCRWW